MKRSRINRALQEAKNCFTKNGWALPPLPRWDVTDFGLGDFDASGLVLLNLAEEAEYCEKLMYGHQGQETPLHCHKAKKEDIIVRWGCLSVDVQSDEAVPSAGNGHCLVKINGRETVLKDGSRVLLKAGERITLVPGVYHAFRPEGGPCIIGEVSTANDDLHDNFFLNPNIGRFPDVEEDEPPLCPLLSDRCPTAGPTQP